MDRYVSDGSDFYSLSQAAQDHYVGLLIDAAVRSQAPVTMTSQPWLP
jgi:hypothetical protein